MDKPEVVVLGVSAPEMEEIRELVFYYPDARAGSANPIWAQGFDVILSAGDEVSQLENGAYWILIRGKKVRVAPGYLWVEDRTYTREKKALKPTLRKES